MKRKRPAGVLVMGMLSVLVFTAGVTMFLFLTDLDAGLAGQPMTISRRLEIVNAAASDIVAKLDQGQTAQADSLFRAAVGELEGQSDAYVELARQLTRRGRPSDAARYLVSAIKDDRDGSVSWDPTLWWALSEAQTKANDPQEAAKSLATAAQREQAEVASIGRPAPSNTDAVADAINRLIRTALFDSDPPYGQGDAPRDLPTAMRLLHEAVRIAPADPTDSNGEMIAASALNALGYALADHGVTRGDYATALDQTKRAVDLIQQAGTREADAVAPEVLDSYGWALYKTGDLPGARRVLREAVDADTDEPECHYHLGVVYAALGLTDDAQLELSRALALDPDSHEAKAALDKLTPPTSKKAVA